MGRRDHARRVWIDAIKAQARNDRIRFVMDFSRDASDTMLDGADPVAGSLQKTGRRSFIGEAAPSVP